MTEFMKLANECYELINSGGWGSVPPKLQRMQAIVKEELGPADPEAFEPLALIGRMYVAIREYASALPIMEQALRIGESCRPKNDPVLGQALDSMATIHAKQGRYERAESISNRAVSSLENDPEKNWIHLAEALMTLADLLEDKGRYASAEVIYKRAITIREAHLGSGEQSIEVGSANLRISYNNLATVYQQTARYADAERYLLKSRELAERYLSPDHPQTAGSMNNLAILYRQMGRWDQAEAIHLQVLKSKESTLGPEHASVATTLHNLAVHYQSIGDWVHAEDVARRAIAILTKRWGAEHPDLARTTNLLASIYKSLGNYPAAVNLIKQTLAIRTKTLGPRHHLVGSTLHNLGHLYMTRGLYKMARPLLEQAQEIREEALGPNNPAVAQSASLLANAYEHLGDNARAEALYKRALKIMIATRGEDHPDNASTMSNLATLYIKQQRNAEEAEALLRRAVEIEERGAGPESPNLVTLLVHLASLLHRQRPQQMLHFLQRSFAISERALRSAGAISSERNIQDLMSRMRGPEYYAYALCALPDATAETRRFALAIVLLRKGRLLDEAGSLSQAAHGSTATTSAQLERLRDLRRQIANLSLAGPGSTTAAQHLEQIGALQQAADAEERELAQTVRALRTLRQLPEPMDAVRKVAACLSADSALIEIIAFISHHGKGLLARVPMGEPTRYLAFILFSNQQVHTVDLGEKLAADKLVRQLIKAFEHPSQQRSLEIVHQEPESDVERISQLAYQKLMQPLETLLGGRRRIYLSLDGELNLLPFAALYNGKNFLIDRYQFTYLTSGRDLLQWRADAPSSRSVVIIADPDLDTASPAAPSQAKTQGQRGTERYSADFYNQLAQLTQLPGARDEAARLEQIFPDATVLSGSAATESAVLKLPAPGILHFATHGVFVPDPEPEGITLEPESPADLMAQVSTLISGKIANPLLRSALVLAGARAASAQANKTAATADCEDGFLTAFEVAGLNLWGTQLMVLSACNSGRGDSKIGEGVYGLRRAASLAGVQTIVSSLWRIDDSATADLMVEFYRRLLLGQGRGEALREAALQLRASHPHPYYWAPFITIGQDGPLVGLRSAPRKEEPAMGKERIYGIDLGTTYSCISYVDEHGQPIVILNAESQSVTPSVVFFENANNIIAGQAAKDAIATSCERVVSTVKRQMGDPFWTFPCDSRTYRPQEISAFILRKLVQDAKQNTGADITDVVITCPAYFGIEQKEATKQAGELAGLNVRYIIPEPTAAAIAYGLQQEKDQVILVYDLGGGTFDITLIEIKDRSIHVIATGGDDHLGGHDWDATLASYMAKCFEAETGTPAHELEDNGETYQDLLLAAERLKKSLTSRQSVKNLIRHGGAAVTVEISRAKFDELTASLLERTVSLTRDMLDRARAKGFARIDKLLLVGGSTRMPQVQERLKQFPFESKFFDPDEAVAKGAALFGMKCMLDDGIRITIAEQTGQVPEKVSLGQVSLQMRKDAETAVARKYGFALPEARKLSTIEIHNVTAKSYGLVIVDEKDPSKEFVRNLVVRDQRLPCTVKQMFGTATEKQLYVELRIMENQQLTRGADPVPLEACTKQLGSIPIQFTRALPKSAAIEVTYSLSPDGLLSVVGHDLTTGQIGKGEWKTEGLLARNEVIEARSRGLRMKVS